jgi:hypothetical protein
MNAIFFDSGPIISLALNNLLWVLDPLKRRFGGQFLITPAVKKELVEVPLTIKRFEYEALQVMRLIDQGILEVFEPGQDVSRKSIELLELMNRVYQCKGQELKIVHEAEVEILAAACVMKQQTMVIDERTVRLMVEDPDSLRNLMEKRLHEKVTMNKSVARQVQDVLCEFHIIRSAEVVAAAYARGMFDDTVPRMAKGKEIMLDALLWGVKTDGCSITEREIDELKKLVA